ncbi:MULTISPECIES: ABC transporter substrate-binding protein [Pseudothermotoga]|uniref:Extracellular solute-binding protein family 1 n=1 Tax=Pseudothermotoga lettingae (strain ATCC BAA-301 / DSM 14385 / NBRC 107922 / TMO) TaxID=416591 RepID=A8F7K9_PSELT|nr:MULTISPECIES: ABC transporter substrate-binding protein [Pseudothermotoga]ABV34143.1 extracellular solute-binding protein family 1 [Pseudothermotoga lettingae TMO]KUK21502.1 MAG: Extracellular solute-binding protein family 1 [Pseudothermotoga lettingae]GLI48913.1 ABC transporter substrate-binding protein [Pseudothermotoga lettingae TMO]HBJ81441.1 ABC transporter substrate-binding protein [Pseudothermotoga sp.]HBT25410.1 ABC transporter substrate-binding protein [Pseudothermotoga sp.]
MKKFLVISLLVLTVLSFAKVKIQFWHAMGGWRIEVIQNMVNDFMKLNPDIEVEVQYVGSYEEILAKTVAAVQAGTPPHVVQLNEISTQKMIDSGVVVPVQDMIDKDPTFDVGLFLPQVLNYYRVGEKLYSMPWNSSTPLLYYNKTLFKEAGLDPDNPPRTYSELIEACRKLVKKDEKGNVIRSGITWPLYSWFFEEYMALQNKSLVDNDNGRTKKATKATFNNEAAMNFLNLWDKLTKEGLMINTKRADWTAARQLFISQTVGMLISSTSDVALLMNESAKQGFELGTAFLPLPDGAQRGGVIIGGGSLWIIKQKDQQEINAAWKLVKYLAEPGPQITWHQATGYFPIRVDAIQTLQVQGYYRDNPHHLTAILQLLTSVQNYNTNGAIIGAFPEVRDAIETAVEKMISGSITPKQALDEAEKNANKAIKEYF